MISHAIVNVACEAGKKNWTSGGKVTVKMRGRTLRAVRFAFPTGVQSQVYLRVFKSGAPLIPDTMAADVEPEPSNGYGVTHNSDIAFPVETEVQCSESLEVQYRNLDVNNTHEVLVDFQFDDLPTDRSRNRS